MLILGRHSDTIVRRHGTGERLKGRVRESLARAAENAGPKAAVLAYREDNFWSACPVDDVDLLRKRGLEVESVYLEST